MSEPGALDGLLIVDLAGTISTAYCGKLFADYGAEVVDLEPAAGFSTRGLAPLMPDQSASAMHAWLSINKLSVLRDRLSGRELESLLSRAAVVLTAETPEPLALSCDNVRSAIRWFGEGGPYSDFSGSDAGCFALNGMLRGIGHVEGPPLMPTGYQAQIVGGISAFIGNLGQVLGAELGNLNAAVELETSIFEAMLSFTDVGVVQVFNTGVQAPRLGINRFPPTYPLGVFPCRDGWIGLTVLTPSQWRTFCELLDLQDLADVPMFQTAVGRLQAIDLLEPMICGQLLEHSAEELFYRAQERAVPLARVPTMEELFGIDQFSERNAFTTATCPDGARLTVPAPAYRLFDTPPRFGGPVPALGEHTPMYASAPV